MVFGGEEGGMVGEGKRESQVERKGMLGTLTMIRAAY